MDLFLEYKRFDCDCPGAVAGGFYEWFSLFTGFRAVYLLALVF